MKRSTSSLLLLLPLALPLAQGAAAGPPAPGPLATSDAIPEEPPAAPEGQDTAPVDPTAGLEPLAGPLDEALLEALGTEARGAVEAHLGVELPDVSIRLCSDAQLIDVLALEFEPQLLTQLGDPDEAQEGARAMARGMAPALVAKYGRDEGAVLVPRDGIQTLAEALERPGFASREVLRVVLVHELVHALDAERMDAVLGSARKTEEFLAANALIEGHAQHVTRAVCAAQGWTPGFVAFTDSIVHVPEGLDPSLAYSMRMAASHFSFAYVEGERFFAAVEAARGPEGVAAVWADPPLEPALIGEPGWYLDPSTRVSFRYDIEGFFRTLGEELGEQGWSCQQIPLLPAQLAVAFSLLPPEDARVVLARLLQARLVMASPLDDPTGGVQIGLMEMATPGSAEALFVLEQRLLVAKDEAMRGTAIEILSAEYEHFELDGERALLSAKTLSAYGQELEVQSLIAVRGTLVLELNHVGTLVEREVLEAEARRYLAPPAVAVSEPSGESPAEELPVDGD